MKLMETEIKIAGVIKKSQGSYLLVGSSSGTFFVTKASLQLVEGMTSEGIAHLSSFPENTVLAQWEHTSAPLMIDNAHLESLIQGFEVIAVSTKIDKTVVVECDEETQLRIGLKEFKGHPYIELRRYVLRKHGDFTRAGTAFTFPPVRIDELIEILNNIQIVENSAT